MMNGLGSLATTREKLLEEARQALELSGTKFSVDVSALRLELLVDALGQGTPELAAAALVESLTEVPLDAALVGLGALRRAALRASSGSTAAIDFFEEAIERAGVSLARAARDAAAQAHAAALRAQEHYGSVFSRLPAIVHSIDGEGKLCAVNDRWIEALGYSREEALGRRSTEFLTPESAKFAREVVLPAYFESGRCDNILYQFVRKDGSLMDVMLSAITDHDEQGRKISQAVLTDVTERLAAERAAQALVSQEETIRAQREMLRAISTPLVPLGDGILLMPLVGSVDHSRAEQIMSVLLEGVVGHAAEVAILDVTGVPSMDLAVAEAIVGVTKAVGLLGARVILTGLGPSAARTLVELGFELGTITTKATLRDGLASARRRFGAAGHTRKLSA